jgi:hypothetical protein
MTTTLRVRKESTMMTKREFLNAVIANVEVAEIAEFAKVEIEKMDARNAKRSHTPSKTAIANEPIKKAIVDLLRAYDEPVVASVIAEKMEISTQKASALCRQLVTNGQLSAVEVKVKGKGKQKGYSVA